MRAGHLVYRDRKKKRQGRERKRYEDTKISRYKSESSVCVRWWLDTAWEACCDVASVVVDLFALHGRFGRELHRPKLLQRPRHVQRELRRVRLFAEPRTKKKQLDRDSIVLASLGTRRGTRSSVRAF